MSSVWASLATYTTERFESGRELKHDYQAVVEPKLYPKINQYAISGQGRGIEDGAKNSRRRHKLNCHPADVLELSSA